ncbi:hypothetical protein TrRE_jg7505 [Triparma retinervis]|uniref:WW domain-containing protein n=1 Tax=Triparma retinervis TaxID=2557542 RepID=A0A9W7AMK5_9STRA|nr:hypothetical protein TrRE_jg7505 [Triparma retinervis]
MRASLLARRIGRQSQNVAGLFGSGFGVEKSTDKKPAEAKEWTLEKSFWTHPFVLRMLGYFGAESTRIRRSEALFFSCRDQANKPAFFKQGKVRRDFRSRHMLLSLHVWIIHRRLIHHESSGEYGKLLQEALFDRLWDDSLTRIRAQNLAELTVNSHLNNVQKYTFAGCMSFDHSQTFDEGDEKRLDELGGALWRDVFLRNDKLPVDHVLRLASYVQREREMVMNLPEELFLEGRIPWGPPPDWRNVKTDEGFDFEDEESEQEMIQRQKEEVEKSGGVFLDDVDLPEGWSLAITEEGKVYYWNTETRESRWEKPKE